MSDEDLMRLGIREVIHRLRRSDSEKMQLMMDHSNMMKDVNKKMQMHLKEIRALKEVNQKLQAENQELRDLCCFLDDDREKGRKLAREWQRFGKYTSSVMNHEVINYKQQLAELSEKQQALRQDQERLVKENAELKELCVFLDQERARLSQPPGERDDGDGCSSSTTQNGDETSPSSSDSTQPPSTETNTAPSPTGPSPHTLTPTDTPTLLLDVPAQNLGSPHTSPVSGDLRKDDQHSKLTADTLRYIKQLEARIQQLEKEMVVLSESQKEKSCSPATRESYQQPRKYFSTPLLSTLTAKREDTAPPKPRRLLPPPSVASSPMPAKPDTVEKALKVLQLQDQVEHGYYGDGVEMGDTERDILRGMCDVVWKKLGVQSSNAGTPL